MKHIKKFQYLFIPFLPILVVTLFVLFTHNNTFALFNPQGIIAHGENRIIVSFIAFVCICIVLPLFMITFFIAWKYRAGNTKSEYTPDWVHERKFEFLWWILPTTLILIMGAFMWKSTHELDPTKALASPVKPMTIQVVALRWKWLFIYPQQHIATVNFVEFPEKTPVAFQLTADAPMNSFWIPNLGGQMYAMVGMVNTLHLMSDSIGEFPGSTAEMSGEGFAGMKFVAKAVSDNDFATWVESVKKSPKQLSTSEYNKLSQDSENNPQMFYAGYAPNLYSTIIMKYMAPK